MHIIQVPSVFTCKLPGGRWLNLAQARSFQQERDLVLITWSNGNQEIFRAHQARAILETLALVPGVDKTHLEPVSHD